MSDFQFPPPAPGQIERFLSLLDTSNGPDSCWPWHGRRNRTGYGRTFRLSLPYGPQHSAHRVAFEWLGQTPIPKGLAVCDTCDNRACCNPRHLFAGSQKENVHDMITKGRRAHFKGARNGASRLNTLNVVEIVCLLRSGRTKAEVGRIFGVSDCAIGFIARREHWKHILSAPLEVDIKAAAASLLTEAL